MDEQGVNGTELAKRCGVTPGAITIFFRPKTKVCRFVAEICAALNIPPPEYLDDRDAEVVRDLRKLRSTWPGEFDRIAAKIRAALVRHSKN